MSNINSAFLQKPASRGESSAWVVASKGNLTKRPWFRARTGTALAHFARDKALAFILPVLLLVAWEVGSRMEWFSSVLLPSPERTFGTLLDLLRSGDLELSLKITLGRVIAGFLVGSIAGFLVGAAMALFKSVDRYAGPFFHALRQVPIYGWMPFLILWLGVGEVFKVAFIAVGAFYPLVLNTYEGIKAVSPHHLEVASVFEYGKFKLFRKVIFPAALPSIFTGIRFGLGHCWMLVIGAEFLASTSGIGYLMAWSRTLMQSDVVISCIFTVGAIGFLMDCLIRGLEHHLLRWRRFTLSS